MDFLSIEQTRGGGLGSSDAKMVARIGRTGVISDTARRRLAVMLGLESQVQFSTLATERGHRIENELYQEMIPVFPDVVSNPYHEAISLSEKYGFRVFNHIDMEVCHSAESAMGWETKAVQGTAEETLHSYREQLQWHLIIGASCFQFYILYLLHYQTDNKDLPFDIEQAAQIPVAADLEIQADIYCGLEIISEAVKDFQYTRPDELVTYDLPEAVQTQIQELADKIKLVESMNDEVDEFKAKMLILMATNNVKSIKNEYFNITLVEETTATGFDKDRLKSDLPDVYKKYNTKTSKKKAFLKITIKNKSHE